MTVLSAPDEFARASQDWDELIAAAIRFRRRLHRHPELTWQEVETAASIRAVLDGLNVPWRACAGTGTIARFAPHAPGRHVALRADIDALPIAEQSGASWSSAVDGVMHACGHDGHTAALMAAATWLKRHEDDLPGPVSLLFQPAEEGGHGARTMIEDGALEGVDVIFGWHNWPSLRSGRAVCPDGAVMAGNGTFRIVLQGRGGHASQPEACRDPVLAAAAVTLALQQIVARRLPPQHAAVLSVTSIDAPSQETVIPDRAVLAGSIRIAESADREVMDGLIEEIAKQAAKSYGVTAEVQTFRRYDATLNHAGPAAELRAALGEELGAGWREDRLPLPVMASEDFSYYLQQIPGAFALIGADDGEGHDIALHSPRYDFNDALIPVVTRLYARLAGAPLPLAKSHPAAEPAPIS